MGDVRLSASEAQRVFVQSVDGAFFVHISAAAGSRAFDPIIVVLWIGAEYARISVAGIAGTILRLGA
jgi:hypothetical protein